MKLEPVLLNPEFQDPVLVISIPQKAETLLFDLGYCFRLKIRDLQKISRIFISHTHIDHFAGFDHILRLSVDLDKTISIYGPPGFLANVEGKLAGFTWNLKESVSLVYQVYEIHPDRIFTKTLQGKEGFKNPSAPDEIEYDGKSPIVRTPEYTVHAAILDHQMQTLGYRLQAVDSFNAEKDAMKSLGLEPGKWVGRLKDWITGESDNDEPFEIDGREFRPSELAKKIIKVRPGTRVAYVVDTIFSKKTANPLKQLVKDVDYFFCECAYLTSERDLARKNFHLTARQAATIALEAGAGKLFPFHFSRRYDGRYDELYQEAREVFPEVETARKYPL